MHRKFCFVEFKTQFPKDICKSVFREMVLKYLRNLHRKGPLYTKQTMAIYCRFLYILKIMNKSFGKNLRYINLSEKTNIWLLCLLNNFIYIYKNTFLKLKRLLMTLPLQISIGVHQYLFSLAPQKFLNLHK